MHDHPVSDGSPAPAGADRAFEEVANFAPVMIWRSGPDKRCDWFNKPWLDFVGRPLARETGSGWIDGVHPDDLDRRAGIYTTSFDARRPFSVEYRLRRHDGEYRWLLDNGAPFYRKEIFAGYFGSCVDVSTHKELEAGQLILVNELNHRVKNMLATVQSMAAHSLRGRPGTDAYDMFTSRLVALSRAHDALMRRNWEGAMLADILTEAVAPYLGREDALEMSGPPVCLVPKAALILSMILHELGTNAGRFGALSTSAGRVAVSWAPGSGENPHFTLRWEERGGPPVHATDHQGFGVRLARQLGRELDGAVQLDFPVAGAVFTMNVPGSNVAT